MQVEAQEAIAIVHAQAEDEGLWFEAVTSSEDYLQRELRRLHAAVEKAAQASPEPLPERWKGDPRDVAAYCAFLWHHGQSTAALTHPSTPQSNELRDEQIDEAAHELQAVIAKCGGESTECAYDHLRDILAKLPVPRA